MLYGQPKGRREPEGVESVGADAFKARRYRRALSVRTRVARALAPRVFQRPSGCGGPDDRLRTVPEKIHR